MTSNDYILGDDGDLVIQNGDFLFGDSRTDDVDLIIATNQGEWKQDPLTGCNMVERMRSKQSPDQIQRAVRIQVMRDGMNFNEVRKHLETVIRTK